MLDRTLNRGDTGDRNSIPATPLMLKQLSSNLPLPGQGNNNMTGAIVSPDTTLVAGTKMNAGDLNQIRGIEAFVNGQASQVSLGNNQNAAERFQLIS